ncbi:hypothetical protein GCM10027169_24260 [Gordonia jinhuaensis]
MCAPSEDVGDDLGDRRLGGRLRESGIGVRELVFGLGQALAVEFSTGVDRELGQHGDRRGHHVGRQRRGEGAVQGGGVGGVRLRARAHHVGGQTFGLAGSHHRHGRLGHGGVTLENGLDLAELDALSAQLHLEVPAPLIDQRAVGSAAHHVSGAVHPLAGDERVRHERPGGDARVAHIAAGELRPVQVQLTAAANRNRVQTFVEDDDADIPLR